MPGGVTCTDTQSRPLSLWLLGLALARNSLLAAMSLNYAAWLMLNAPPSKPPSRLQIVPPRPNARASSSPPKRAPARLYLVKR